jgi:hypothetical protein
VPGLRMSGPRRGRWIVASGLACAWLVGASLFAPPALATVASRSETFQVDGAHDGFAYLKLAEHISRDREVAEGLVRRRQARRFPSRQRDHELGPALTT